MRFERFHKKGQIINTTQPFIQQNFRKNYNILNSLNRLDTKQIDNNFVNVVFLMKYCGPLKHILDE